MTDPAVTLHLARSVPSEWGKLVLELSESDPATARLEADRVREHEIATGAGKSELCAAATEIVRAIDGTLNARHVPLGGVVRSSAEFYRGIGPVVSYPVRLGLQ